MLIKKISFDDNRGDRYNNKILSQMTDLNWKDIFIQYNEYSMWFNKYSLDTCARP